jgi:hypothetical protein
MAAKGNRGRIQRSKVKLSLQNNSAGANIAAYVKTILAGTALK